MQHLELTEELRSGIKGIDLQHKELFAWGNAILFPEESLFPESIRIADAFDFLMRYVEYHFLSEEMAMKYHGYERLESHLKQHHRLRNEVNDLNARMNREGITKAFKASLYYFLQDWFVYHIKEWDKQMAQFLKTVETENMPMPRLEDLEKQFDVPRANIGDLTLDMAIHGRNHHL